MDSDVRRHLADLAEEALANGFDHVEIQRRVRAGDGVIGWRLKVAGGVAGPVLAAERTVLEGALADPSYVAELSHLIGLWGRHGIPAEDQVGELSVQDVGSAS